MKLSTKILAVVLGSAIAVAFVVAGVTTTASAAGYVFTRSLTVGSTGADVMELQKVLNANPATQIAATGAGSPGMESSYFGGLTKAALAKFQAANGISPAAGYFGPITMAFVNNAAPVTSTGALCPNGNTLASNCATAPGTTPSTQALCPNGLTLASNCTVAPSGTVASANGTDGTLTAAQSSFVSSGIQLKKGETKNIAAVTLKASVGPVTVTRAGVHFNTRPWLVFGQVVLKDSNGKVLATKTLNSAADATEITVGSDYLVTFEGVNETVTPGQNIDLIVSASVLPATDKIPAAGLTVQVAFDTLRTINGIGWTDSIAASTLSATAGVGSNVVTLTSTGSVADVYGRISPNSPATRQVATSLTQQTSDVVLGTFSLKSANNASTLNTLTVTIASTSLQAGAGGISPITSALSNVRLYNGSTSYGGTLTSAGVVTFSNMTIPLAQDVWQDLTVKADVAASTTATGLTVALNAATGIVVTDANYGTATYEAGTATSNAITLTLNAVTVSNVSATLGSAITDATSATVGYNVLYNFTLTNSSNSDLYVSATTSVLVATTTTGTSGSSTLPVIQTVSPSSYNGDSTGLTASYVIPAGLSRTFTLSGALRGTSGQTGVNMKVSTIYYGTTPTIASDQSTASSITFGLENLVTSASF